jgi:hypothetical protein
LQLFVDHIESLLGFLVHERVRPEEWVASFSIGASGWLVASLAE